jgi:hypothetical protein
MGQFLMVFQKQKEKAASGHTDTGSINTGTGGGDARYYSGWWAASKQASKNKQVQKAPQSMRKCEQWYVESKDDAS